MNLYEGLERLKKKSTILQNMNNGNLYQRYNNDSIWETVTQEENSNRIGGTIKNIEFIKKFVDDNFQEIEQWFHHEIKFPILCKVKIESNEKIVNFISKSGDWFHTGFGESYEVSHHNKIIPLTDKELELYKRGFNEPQFFKN